MPSVSMTDIGHMLAATLEVAMPSMSRISRPASRTAAWAARRVQKLRGSV